MSVVSRSATKWARACLLVALSFAVAACATGRRDDLAYAPASFNVPPDDLVVSRDHRLGPADVIEITVFRAPEVSGEFRVDDLGNIMMPLIGQFPVLGFTLPELSADLRQRLGHTHYVNPDVSVSLKETPGRTFTVDGAVDAPGVYPARSGTTLLQAVALARGTAGSANPRRVYVFRQIDGQRMAAGFDLTSIRRLEMEDPVIYPQDIIIVDGSQTRQAWRDILSTIPILALFRPVFY